MRPRLLVLDDVEGRMAGAPAMAGLRELAEVTVLDRPLRAGDLDGLAGVRVLLAIRERTRLDDALLERLPDLELVLQTGGHAYHVDREAAARRGIVVALSRRAQMASASVPELTFGLMLAVLRRIHPLAAELAAGHWPPAMGRTLAGRTLGILGLGRHGRPVARIAGAFGMTVLAWDRDPGRAYANEEPVAERLPLDELLARAEVVSVHLKLSPSSTGLLDRDRLARMRPGAILVNTARGAIVDEQALVEALRSGHLAGAGLDVFSTEPLPADHPLRTAPNVVLTPHIGWKVEEVFAEWAEIAAEQLAAWLDGRLPAAEVLDPTAAEVPRTRLGGLASSGITGGWPADP
jgi:phosphoglycerate dehydrogenase-like enzyme